jgi:hypothetical protein
VETSILKSVKKNLSLEPTYDVFDGEIIMHINAAFSTLNQLGFGPDGGYSIEDDVSEWTEFVDTVNVLSSVKTYVYLRVRLLFDSPTTEYVLRSFQDQLKELEWRLNVLREGMEWADPMPAGVIVDE